MAQKARAPLAIEIKEPEGILKRDHKLTESSKKQIQLVKSKQKEQIQQMQKQVKKLNSKIQSQCQVIRNRAIQQQLQMLIRKNELASKMSKREIIIAQLQSLKSPNQKISEVRTARKNTILGPIQIVKNKSQKKLKDLAQTGSHAQSPEHNQKNRKIKLSDRYIYQRNRQANKIERIRQILRKQKQYGVKAYEQHSNNRARSAESYLWARKLDQYQLSLIQRQNSSLKSLKKQETPQVPNPQLRRMQEVERVRHSALTAEQKISKLNRLLQIEKSRVEQRELRGTGYDFSLMNHINNVRASILLEMGKV